ncbi:terminase large subunit [Bacillus atrophaeus]|uniref:terminase large subunit n=1 Tax=Bacillus atrophaeus TaxID=1452 RepID=UPI001EFB1DF6|nr:terminase large subunit [Bacillus atrophaeus]
MIDETTLYARKVVKGEIIACRKIKLACQRHLDDIEKSKTEAFNYRFDIEEAQDSISFIETLSNPETGEALELLMFQKWIIGSIFGWIRKDNGHRRFKRAMISMARRNGKSLIVAAIGGKEFILGDSPQMNRKIVFASNAMKQARHGFEYMQGQFRILSRQSKSIKRSVKVLKDSIEDKSSNSKAYPVASDTGKLDGFASTVAIIDEFHESPDLKMYNVLKTGQVGLKSSLLAIVSTAGLNPNVPMYKEIQMLDRVLEGNLTMDDYFIAIYEQDDVEKEIDMPETWIKSNPRLEDEEAASYMVDNIMTDVKAAKVQRNLNSLYVKTFNVWRQASEQSYIPLDDWNACAVEEAPDIRGREVYIGLDMAKIEDLAAVSWIYPLEDEQKRFYIDSHSFVGTKGGIEAKCQRDKIDYKQLAAEGYCTITDKMSGIINEQQVIDYIKNHVQENDLKVKGLMFDPALVSVVLNSTEEYPQIEVGQVATKLNAPVKDFRLSVYDQRILHSNNPLLTEAVNNAIVKEFNDLTRLVKEKNRNKIDPIIAGIIAHYEAMHHYSDEYDQDYYANYNFSL